MRGIKTVLIFLFSAIYTSCFWLIFILPLKSDYKIAPSIFIVFGTIFILIYGFYWLVEHWEDDND